MYVCIYMLICYLYTFIYICVQVLEMLRKLSTAETEEGEDDSPYMKFYQTFGRSIKMGIIEDNANRHKLAKLLRFKTSKSEGNFKSLDEYVEGMPEWQKTIYYVAGEVIRIIISIINNNNKYKYNI